MDAQYPIGTITAAIRNTFGLTLATYVLFVAGTLLGVWIAGDDGWFWGLWTLIAFVIPYLFILTVVHPLLAFCTLPLIVVAWYICLYAESLKLRIGMLALIFGLAFGDAYYISVADAD